jgi:hypothetical protein
MLRLSLNAGRSFGKNHTLEEIGLIIACRMHHFEIDKEIQKNVKH